jgi:SAM-dependent methyltransferase
MKNEPSKPRGKIQEIRDHYDHRISPRRKNHEILDWASHESQHARFQVFADSVYLAGKTLLDVGCGLGDLRAYLRLRNIPADYTGVDVSENMVQAALERQPDGRFLCADVFGETSFFPPAAFDVVFCSGIFNLNLGNNRQFLAPALARLLELAREHAAFNLLHQRSAGSDKKYFYYDPDEILQLLKSQPCQVRIIDNYLHNDFTVVCTKTPLPGRERAG